jgi:putative protease
LGRLGNTTYELAEVHLEQRGQPFAPSSLLNQLRREAVEQLVERQRRLAPITLHDPLATLATALAQAPHEAARLEPALPQLHLLVRTPEQLDAALALQPASITLDYLDLYGLRPAVERVQASGIAARVASPRVLKPNEQRIVRFLLKLECQILVRSSGLLYALQTEDHPPLIGDFSLNAANILSADLFLQLGLSRLTPTHDLNAVQIASLARTIGPDKVELVAYHHLPVFHTEHCVFCRFLSKGTSYKDCGQPCETHRVALRDVNGRSHPVMADVGCRNTVFGAEAQEASRHLDGLRQAGIHHFRLEFVHESAEQVSQVTHAFQETLAGKLTASELTHHLQRLAPQGATQGSLFVPDNYLALPLLQ